MLRWSWRDLRRRWGLVLLTAAIISIGTGTYAGLGGTTAWRLRSNDESYARLEYHDLRVRLPEHIDASQGALEATARSIAGAEQISTAEERLVLPTQVDASDAGHTVLVPGQVVGMSADAHVDTLHIVAGRAPAPGVAEVLLDSKFATARTLPPEGSLTLSGGRQVQYTGTGYTPEYFRVIGGGQQLTGELGFAVLFAPLGTAQELTGHPGRVNDLAIGLRSGADADAVAAELRVSFADLGAQVETRADDEVRRILYADARNDDKMWTFLALLVLLGASFAAFNLISRMVESERHELGIGMAIGTPVRRLAIRPLLVGLQISVLGVVLGVAVGLFAGSAMRDVMTAALPLPVWRTPFQFGRYGQAAIAGIVLPMLATIIPVRRALRVEPVAALRSQTPAVRSRGAGWAPWLRRFRLRGHVVMLMPVRNVLRAPRRTLLTALGIAAAITTLVAVLGLMDSIFRTFDRSDAEVGRTHPGRLEVALVGFSTPGSAEVLGVTGSPVVAEAEPGLRLSGTMGNGQVQVETAIDVIDFSSSMWTPTITSGRAPVGEPGLVISEKAATDLGVRAGDTITLTHPVRQDLSYRLVDTQVPIAAIHPNPIRFFSYLDASQVDLFGLRGIVDRVVVDPAAGRSVDDVKRALFRLPGVASVQEVAVLGDTLQQRMGQFTGILRVLEGFSLVLALLIAVNSATLAIDERRREQATMFAFGLPVGTVLLTIIVETALTALIGTSIGIGTGFLALRWLLHMFTTDTLPEIGMTSVITVGTFVTVMLLGVGVTATAPLFALRRLRRADIPSTLRVLE